MTLRLVLVDDDARFRRVAVRALSAEGIEVLAEVADGESAVAAVALWNPDVVLVDIGLPGIDGLEVAQRLRAEQAGAVVILISTREASFGQRVADGLAAGFLTKAELSLSAILALASPSA